MFILFNLQSRFGCYIIKINTYDPVNQKVFSCIFQCKSILLHIQYFHHFRKWLKIYLRLFEESNLCTQHHDDLAPVLIKNYFHSPCFSSTSLPICKNSTIKSTNYWFYHWNRYFLIDFDLLCVGAKYSIKSKVIFRFLYLYYFVKYINGHLFVCVSNTFFSFVGNFYFIDGS